MADSLTVLWLEDDIRFVQQWALSQIPLREEGGLRHYTTQDQSLTMIHALNPEEAVEWLKAHTPDLALLDIDMSENAGNRLQSVTDGIGVARILAERHPVPVVFLSHHPRSQYEAAISDAVKSGKWLFISKDTLNRETLPVFISDVCKDLVRYRAYPADDLYPFQANKLRILVQPKRQLLTRSEEGREYRIVHLPDDLSHAQSAKGDGSGCRMMIAGTEYTGVYNLGPLEAAMREAMGPVFDRHFLRLRSAIINLDKVTALSTEGYLEIGKTQLFYNNRPEDIRKVKEIFRLPDANNKAKRK